MTPDQKNLWLIWSQTCRLNVFCRQSTGLNSTWTHSRSGPSRPHLEQDVELDQSQRVLVRVQGRPQIRHNYVIFWSLLVEM